MNTVGKFETHGMSSVCLKTASLFFFCFFFSFPFSGAPIFGFADDYVFMIRGLLDLYEASLDEQWLQWAVGLQAKLDELFWDSAGAGYFMVTPDDPSILVRMKEG